MHALWVRWTPEGIDNHIWSSFRSPQRSYHDAMRSESAWDNFCAECIWAKWIEWKKAMLIAKLVHKRICKFGHVGEQKCLTFIFSIPQILYQVIPSFPGARQSHAKWRTEEGKCDGNWAEVFSYKMKYFMKIIMKPSMFCWRRSKSNGDRYNKRSTLRNRLALFRFPSNYYGFIITRTFGRFCLLFTK